MANWIAKAVKGGKGKFAAKAKKAGMSTAAFAKQEMHAKGMVGNEARLAQTLMGMHKSPMDGAAHMTAQMKAGKTNRHGTM